MSQKSILGSEDIDNYTNTWYKLESVGAVNNKQKENSLRKELEGFEGLELPLKVSAVGLAAFTVWLGLLGHIFVRAEVDRWDGVWAPILLIGAGVWACYATLGILAGVIQTICPRLQR